MVQIDRYPQTNPCIMETKVKTIEIIDGVTKVKWNITNIDIDGCECSESDFIYMIGGGNNTTTICSSHNNTDISTIKTIESNKKIKPNKNGVPLKKKHLKF